jgi:hypothetical protein
VDWRRSSARGCSTVGGSSPGRASVGGSSGGRDHSRSVGGDAAAPHAPQNRAPGGNAAPHCVQKACSGIGGSRP